MLYRWASTVIIIVFLGFSVWPCFAQTMVEAKGMALVEPDVNISRDLAVLRAKQHALETLGIGIQAKNLSAQGRLLDEIIMVQTSGFVDGYEVLEEGEQNGYYHVRLRARIKEGDGLEEAYGSVFKGKILSISGKGPGSKNVETRLRRRLVENFYYVLHPDQRELKSDYRILVYSEVEPYSDLGSFKSFYAKVSITMTQASIGRQVIHSTPTRPILIYGKYLNQALNGITVNQYPRKVTEPLLNSFWKELITFENKGMRVLRIEIFGLPGPEAFCSFRDYVKSIRLGMKDVYGEQYKDGRGILEVNYQEKSFYLATIIGYRSQYRVTGHDWDRIQVKYVGEKR